MFQSSVPLSVPPRCFLWPCGDTVCSALSFGPWGGEQNPAWGPVLVVKAFLQTCPRWGWQLQGDGCERCRGCLGLQ